MHLAVKSAQTQRSLCITDEAALLEDGQAPPAFIPAASDPSRLASSDVALCAAGQDNDVFNEGPQNHVTVDLVQKIQKGLADDPAVMRANSKLHRSPGLIFTFNESRNQVRALIVRCRRRSRFPLPHS